MVSETKSQSPFSTHLTRKGHEYFYRGTNGGFQTITGIPITSLACLRCHPGVLPNGTPVDTTTYQPSCNDCHNFTIGYSVPDSTCKKCHSRQKVEIANYTDKHRSAGFSCVTCHPKEEMHLDATNYNSIFDTPPGKTCQSTGCHVTIPVTGDDSLAHSIHISKLECASCHARAEINCYNCHFETELWSSMKGFKRPIGQLKGFIMLGRLPIQQNKIGLVNYQSTVYQGKSFNAYGPYYAHTIMPKDSTRTCDGCHNNANINELNTTGQLYVAKWDSATKKIIHKTGVIPIPSNYQDVFKFDFANYTGRIDTTYTDPTKWVFMKTGLDGQQMLPQYVLPLTNEQMQKLGYVIGIRKISSAVPEIYNLYQNYPNPFNPLTHIKIQIAKSGFVKLKVFDALGREIAVLVNEIMKPGIYDVEFDGSGFSSGIYFYKLITNDYTQTKKMILIK
jgi:hypothetical protein